MIDSIICWGYDVLVLFLDFQLLYTMDDWKVVFQPRFINHFQHQCHWFIINLWRDFSWYCFYYFWVSSRVFDRSLSNPLILWISSFTFVLSCTDSLIEKRIKSRAKLDLKSHKIASMMNHWFINWDNNFIYMNKMRNGRVFIP